MASEIRVDRDEALRLAHEVEQIRGTMFVAPSIQTRLVTGEGAGVHIDAIVALGGRLTAACQAGWNLCEGITGFVYASVGRYQKADEAAAQHFAKEGE